MLKTQFSPVSEHIKVLFNMMIKLISGKILKTWDKKKEYWDNAKLDKLVNILKGNKTIT